MTTPTETGVTEYSFHEDNVIPHQGDIRDLVRHLYVLKNREAVPDRREGNEGRTIFVDPVIPEKVVVLDGETTVYFQYVLVSGNTETYKVNKERYGELLKTLAISQGTPEIAVELDYVTRNMGFGNQTYIELPITVSQDIAPHPLDNVTGEDLTFLATSCDELRLLTTSTVEYVTKLADKFGQTIATKDHDLYLVFKGNEDFSKLNICLEKVYPKLPESGELSLGDTPLKVSDWDGLFAGSLQMLEGIALEQSHYNTRLTEKRALFNTPGRVALLPQFEREVRTMMMAASHMLKMVYGFSIDHANKVVYKEANAIVQALEKKGGPIGLDLNSWIVWDYTTPDEPVRIKDDELDFLKHYLNRYTDSFMDALYGVLLNTPHPNIKPYSVKEMVTEDDGVAIGTISTRTVH